MVRFRRTSKPRNYLSRREQWRMLLLVMSLGLVFYMMTDDARNNLRGLIEAFFGENPHAADPSGEPPVDNVLQRRGAEDKIPGTFISPAEDPPGTQEEPAGRYFPGVEPKLLGTIRDDTIFRDREQESWFNLLKVLQATDQETLEKAKPRPATYVQLFRQSNEYRGELVTVSGTVRRAVPTGIARNDLGIKKYWQVWLQPDDNRFSPLVVYCLYLPKDFPTGMKVAADVEIAGFFFKRWMYSDAKSDLRTAPVVVARSLKWQPPPPEEQKSSGPGLGDLLWIMAGAAVVSVLAAVFVFRRTRPARAEEGAEAPNFDALNEAGPESNP